jgi:hypothetical protein
MVVINHHETLLSSCLPLIALALADVRWRVCDMALATGSVRFCRKTGPFAAEMANRDRRR